VTVDGAHWGELLAGLERACGALDAAIARADGAWDRARPGHWTCGQHAEHVVRTMELFPPPFDVAAAALRAGTLAPPPARKVLERLFLAVVVRRGFMPRGGPAAPATFPGDAPQPDDVRRRLQAGVAWFAATAAGLDAAALDRLWVLNPIMQTNPNAARLGWHYTLPEAARIQSVHVRHHLKQMDELAAAAGSRR